MRSNSSGAIQAGLLLSGGHEALEFFEPVLDEDQFSDRLGLSFIELYHQEPLAVEGDVPTPNWIRHSVSGFLK